MKTTVAIGRWMIAATGMACCLAHAQALDRGELALARYTTQPAQPSEAEADPMAVIVQVRFPRELVDTVGDAVRYLLLRTGYTLSAMSEMDEAIGHVMAKRLPESHRQLGAYRVDVLLQLLMGKPFKLVIDAPTRTISYLPPSSIPSYTQPAATTGSIAQ